MTDSQDWWPGRLHPGPLFIRMARHSAGTIARVTGAAVAGADSNASPAQQLAGQRQPRQSAASPLADQTKSMAGKFRGPT